MFSNPDCVAIKGVKGHICPWHSRPSSAGAPAVPRANEPCSVGGKACRSARLWAGSSHGRLPRPSEAPPEEKMREWPPASGFPQPWVPPSAIQGVAGGVDAEVDETGVGVAEALWLSPRQLASHASGRGRRAESCAGHKRKNAWARRNMSGRLRCWEHSMQCKLDSFDLSVPRQSKKNQGCLSWILNYFHLESCYKRSQTCPISSK